MATTLLNGHSDWRLSRDDEGHREYRITHKVRADPADGPGTVMITPGLPAVGSVWSPDNDNDSWAFCTPRMIVTPMISDEPNTMWKVEQTFSTKPQWRCSTASIEDPLLEPDRLSGSFVKGSVLAYEDRFGNVIKTSSHELYHGPEVEFDANRPSVRIDQNTSALGLSTFSLMVDTVNDAPLWGLPARCIKLSNVSWERKTYGVCNYYYTRSLEFDVMYNTFDRDLPDRGTMVLNGRWNKDTGQWEVLPVHGVAADPDNPQHFIQYKDRRGELGVTLLDGAGKPWNGVGTQPYQEVEYYPESNFLLLGVPATL